MPRRLDIDALRALQAIAVHGGVTRAADSLSLSQSAVSHKIKRLEDDIGCALLNRRAGTSLLSETGNRLLGYANRILSLHDEAVLSLSSRALCGKIRLGMTEDITASGLSRILGRFTQLYREVSVQTHVAQSLTLQNELKNGTIDIAVMQVFAIDVRTDDLVLYRDELIWAKALDLELDWNRPVPFLAYDDNCFYKSWLMEHGLLAGHTFDTVFTCTSNTGMIKAVEAGLGVAILSRRHLSRAMVELTQDVVPPPDIAYIVRSSMKPKSQAVSALADEIEREAHTFPALETG